MVRGEREFMSDYFESWHAREQRAFAREQRRHGNITDDPSYQAFVLEMTLRCHCTPESDRPCDGLLAGGLCDDLHLGPREACDGFDEDEPDNL
jgi:hypothetical protein